MRSGRDRTKAKEEQEISDRLRSDLRARRKEARKLRLEAEARALEEAAAAAEAANTPPGAHALPTPSSSGNGGQSTDVGETVESDHETDGGDTSASDESLG